MTIEELYKDFCENFNKDHALSQDSSTPKWTEAILKYFFELGKDDYEVYTNPKVIRESEGSYLVDLCWSKKTGKKHRDYRGLDLILESEWSTKGKEIMNDFDKLIDVKSLLKVMVICVEERKIGDILQKMTKAIGSSRIKFKDENYLAIIFIPFPTIRAPERYVIEGYKINSEGKSQKLQQADFILDHSSVIKDKQK